MYNGNTALIFAAAKDDNVVGANVNNNDISLTQPIITSNKATFLLIDAGANWNLKNDQNRDFLDYLTVEEKNRIIGYYPEKYKKYLIIKSGQEEYNL